MTKTVLVPLDGSPLAEGALPTATWLARSLGAELHLVSTEVGPRRLEQREYLDAVHDRLGIDGVVTHVVGHRWPAPGIIDTLDSLTDPLVCMTTKGSSGWAATLLGTVTDEVLTTTADPVVLIGPTCGARPDPTDGAILLCVDGSEESLAVLPTVTEITAGLGRSVDLVTTAQTGGSDRGDARAVRAEQVLADAARPLQALDVEVSTHLLFGASPADLVVELARQTSASLIAIGTHGRSGLSARALGHVASDIVSSSPCPVLVRRLRR